MTVNDLTKILQTLPPDLTVVNEGYETGFELRSYAAGYKTNICVFYKDFAPLGLLCYLSRFYRHSQCPVRGNIFVVIRFSGILSSPSGVTSLLYMR